VKSAHLVATLLLASSALAMPERWTTGIDGVGRISVNAGWKLTPNDYFYARALEQGDPAVWKGYGGPQLGASFGYGALSWIEASIDLFFGHDRFEIGGYHQITALTYGALVGVRFTFMDLFFPGFCPYIGAGVGPTLGYVFAEGVEPVEKLVTGVAANAGITYRFNDRLGVSLEYRFLYARGMWHTSGVNIGGSWISLAVVVYFPRSPSEVVSTGM